METQGQSSNLPLKHRQAFFFCPLNPDPKQCCWMDGHTVTKKKNNSCVPEGATPAHLLTAWEPAKGLFTAVCAADLSSLLRRQIFSSRLQQQVCFVSFSARP